MERNQSFLFPTDVFHLSGGSKCLVRLGANYSSALATNPTPNFDQFLLKSVSRPVKLLLLSVSAPCSSSPRVSIYVAASETLFLNCGTLGCLKLSVPVASISPGYHPSTCSCMPVFGR